MPKMQRIYMHSGLLYQKDMDYIKDNPVYFVLEDYKHFQYNMKIVSHDEPTLYVKYKNEEIKSFKIELKEKENLLSFISRTLGVNDRIKQEYYLTQTTYEDVFAYPAKDSILFLYRKHYSDSNETIYFVKEEARYEDISYLTSLEGQISFFNKETLMVFEPKSKRKLIEIFTILKKKINEAKAEVF